MTPLALPFLSALVAGCLHALESDHLAAVTTFVARRPDPAHAFGFGLRWGLGHSAAILVVGGALIVLELHPPAAFVSLLEGGVGLMLVGLGLWILRGAFGRPACSTAGARADGRPLRVSHGTTWVGAAHGLAGTAGFLALIPATMLDSPWLAAAYLALFGAGTMLAMGTYAAGAGLLMTRVGGGVPGAERVLRIGAGLASVAIGIAWLLGAG